MNKFRIIIAVFLLFLFVSAGAQHKGTFGVSISALNKNTMLQSAAVNHDFTTYKGNGFLSFSADYWYPVNEWIEIETGLNYSHQSFEMATTHSWKNNLAVPLQNEEYVNYYLINIPVGVRAEFLEFGFVNGGLLIDIAQHEPGIGSYFGLGVKFESLVGYGLYINPYLKTHSVLPVNLNFNNDRILEAGIKIGIFYSFDNNFFNR